MRHATGDGINFASKFKRKYNEFQSKNLSKDAKKQKNRHIFFENPIFFGERPNASERAQTHPNASERIRTGPSRSQHVQKLQKTCENFEKLRENFENFAKLAEFLPSPVAPPRTWLP